MAKIRIRYLTSRKGRNGKLRYYWQPKTDLIRAGWKVERLPDNEILAMQRAEELNKDLDAWRDGTRAMPFNAKQGSVEALVLDYKNSRHYRDLAAKTKQSYDWCILILLRLIGDRPVITVSPKTVQTIYDGMRDKTPTKAAAVIRVLRIVMQYAVRQNLIEINPASRPGLKQTAKKGLIWSPAAVAAFVKTADSMGYHSHGTAVLLNEWIGQRLGDVLALSVSAAREDGITLRQNKTGATVSLPVQLVPHLAARIADQQRRNRQSAVASTVLIAAPSGGAFRIDWFSHLFAKIRTQAAADHPEIAEMPQLVFKNLRHTAVTRMAEAGCKVYEIAAVTGHKLVSCQQIIDRYMTRTKKMSENAFLLRMAAEENQP